MFNKQKKMIAEIKEMLDEEYPVPRTNREAIIDGFWEGSGMMAWIWLIPVLIFCLVTHQKLDFVKR